MKSAGQILQSTRLSQKLDLDDVARITKIRAYFLSLLEADDYSRLPHGATARGFIRNYSEFLNLNSDYILAIFRRDFVENQQGQIVPRAMAQPIAPVSFWTPKTTVIAAVTSAFTLLGFYLIYQYYLLTGPPPLKLFSPPDLLTTTQDSIEIRGQTDPEATIAVNSQLVALDKGGTFYLRLPLIPGSNPITITATGKSGRTTTISRVVNLTTSP